MSVIVDLLGRSGCGGGRSHRARPAVVGPRSGPGSSPGMTRSPRSGRKVGPCTRCADTQPRSTRWSRRRCSRSRRPSRWLSPETAGRRPEVAAFAAVMTIALAFRRSHPLGSLAGAMAGFAGLSLTGELPTVTFLLPVGLLSLYSCGAHATGERAVIGLGIALAAVGLGAARTADATITDLTAPALLFTGAWFVGRSQLVRRMRLGRAEARAEAAAEEERRRIARELHDIVAHRVSTIVIQAEAGIATAREPERAEQAFGAIAGSGRLALGELRSLLGVLRDGDAAAATAPQPGLARLEALLAETRGAGRAGRRAGRRRRRRPARRGRPRRLSRRPGGAHERAPPRAHPGRRGDPPRRRRRRAGDPQRARRTRLPGARRRRGPRAWRACASGSGSPAASSAPGPAGGEFVVRARGSRSRAARDVGPGGRRPGARPRGLRTILERRDGIEVLGRGGRRPRGGARGAPAAARRGADGRPDARPGRDRGRARAGRLAVPDPDAHHVRPRRVRLRRAARRRERLPAQGRAARPARRGDPRRRGAGTCCSRRRSRGGSSSATRARPGSAAAARPRRADRPRARGARADRARALQRGDRRRRWS